MSKRDRYFEKVNEFKERFRHLTAAQLEQKLAFGALVKEAAVAARELLEERQLVHQLQDHNARQT